MSQLQNILALWSPQISRRTVRHGFALVVFLTSAFSFLSSNSCFADTLSEGAENGIVRYGVDTIDGIRPIVNVPTNWNVINSRFTADSATHSFRFLHEGTSAWPTNQWLLLANTLHPQSDSKLIFKSMLGLMEAGESALVQISASSAAMPPENSWVTVYTQSGSSHNVETSFQSREVSLAQFNGQSIRVRFVYFWDQVAGWYWQNIEGNDQGWSSGWYIDQIAHYSGGSISQLDGAENGLLKYGIDSPDGVRSLVSTTSNWNVMNSRFTADSVSHSFRFLHEGTAAWPINQWLLIPKTITPQLNSLLSFKSMLGLMEAGEAALVQVSTSTSLIPPENSWTSIFTLSGNNHNLETSFQSKELSLSSYAGQNIRIRFVYFWNQIAGWYWQDIEGNELGWSSGWYLDNIVITNATFSSNNQPIPSNTPTPIATATRTATATSTNTATPTASNTLTATNTPTPTYTATRTATSGGLPPNTATPTYTPTRTATATSTNTSPAITITASPTATAISTATIAIKTPTATNTPSVANPSKSPTPSPTAKQTIVTEQPTATPLPTNTTSVVATSAPKPVEKPQIPENPSEISGKVVDSSSLSIEHAIAYVSGLVPVISNSNGQFKITSLESGKTYKVIPQKAGYKFDPSSALIAAGSSVFAFVGTKFTATSECSQTDLSNKIISVAQAAEELRKYGNSITISLKDSATISAKINQAFSLCMLASQGIPEMLYDCKEKFSCNKVKLDNKLEKYKKAQTALNKIVTSAAKRISDSKSKLGKINKLNSKLEGAYRKLLKAALAQKYTTFDCSKSS